MTFLPETGPSLNENLKLAIRLNNRDGPKRGWSFSICDRHRPQTFSHAEGWCTALFRKLHGLEVIIAITGARVGFGRPTAEMMHDAPDCIEGRLHCTFNPARSP